MRGRGSDDDDEGDDFNDGDGFGGRGRQEKKPRIQDFTEDVVVQQALMQEEAEKAAKKRGKQGGRGGGAEESIHEGEEEKGPVKESLVQGAQAKRAARRSKKQGAGARGGGGAGGDLDMDVDESDLDLLDNLGAFEEDAVEVEEEGGVRIIPFSLKPDRDEGEIDDEGNFVINKKGGEKSAGVKDAWLDSTEVVTDKVKAALEERRKAMDAADAEEERRASAPMTDRQIAAVKSQLALGMMPEETVAAALKRVRGTGSRGGAGGAGPKVKRMGGRGEGGEGVVGVAPPPLPHTPGDLELFLRMTEGADILFAEGEMDIFACTKEELQKSAAMWLPATIPTSTPASAPAAAVPVGTSAAADEEDNDMFAEQDGSKETPVRDGNREAERIAPAAPTTAPGAAGITSGAAGVTSSSASGPTADTAAAAAGVSDAEADETTGFTGFASWPIKEISRFLRENGAGAAASGVVEKGDLVSLALATERRMRSEAAAEASLASGLIAGSGGVSGRMGEGLGGVEVPRGFTLDPSTGYYRSAELGMSWDASSGAYWDGSKWVLFNGREYVPL